MPTSGSASSEIPHIGCRGTCCGTACCGAGCKAHGASGNLQAVCRAAEWEKARFLHTERLTHTRWSCCFPECVSSDQNQPASPRLPGTSSKSISNWCLILSTVESDQATVLVVEEDVMELLVLVVAVRLLVVTSQTSSVETSVLSPQNQHLYNFSTKLFIVCSV